MTCMIHIYCQRVKWLHMWLYRVLDLCSHILLKYTVQFEKLYCGTAVAVVCWTGIVCRGWRCICCSPLNILLIWKCSVFSISTYSCRLCSFLWPVIAATFVLVTTCLFNFQIMVFLTRCMVSLLPVCSKPPTLAMACMIVLIPTGIVMYHTSFLCKNFLIGVRYSGPLVLHDAGLWSRAVWRRCMGHFKPPVA